MSGRNQTPPLGGQQCLSPAVSGRIQRPPRHIVINATFPRKLTLPCETGSPLRGCEKGVTLSGLLVTVHWGCHLSRSPAQAADLVSDQ